MGPGRRWVVVLTIFKIINSTKTFKYIYRLGNDLLGRLVQLSTESMFGRRFHDFALKDRRGDRPSQWEGVGSYAEITPLFRQQFGGSLAR